MGPMEAAQRTLQAAQDEAKDLIKLGHDNEDPDYEDFGRRIRLLLSQIKLPKGSPSEQEAIDATNIEHIATTIESLPERIADGKEASLCLASKNAIIEVVVDQRKSDDSLGFVNGILKEVISSLQGLKTIVDGVKKD